MSATVRGEESETESDREARGGRVCEAQRKDLRNRENSYSLGFFDISLRKA